ncbi:MAG: YezD family protein [Verrucomicrobiales bacterium]
MSTPSHSDPELARWLQVIEQKVAALRFGSVQVVVHEGRVTQIESTEKFRFNSRPSDVPTSVEEASDRSGDVDSNGPTPKPSSAD